ncbi:DUF2231 domain-containing protein [Occallatibacter savannae]|uniref:DUF2231 domain-containing protein n=1 Tax=Occallatibacter savannae TaxID=1002691 RepID=UPI000D689C73|nr:DUF2231 domain-containing protein [Occallatibacter savannae]
MPAHQTTSVDPIARAAEQQSWIKPEFETAVQGAIHSAFESMGEVGDNIKSLLHGEWMHEPLHAAVTDVPIGAWTATVAFDSAAALTGRSELDFAADATLYLGLAGAALSAVAGIADWSEIREPAPRRIGTVHALLNIGATVLFASSCFARHRDKNRAGGRALAAAAYTLVALSAHLGGNLVYEHGVGVQQKNEDDASSTSTQESEQGRCLDLDLD